MAKLTQLIDNEIFRAYATYATIVLLKMMLMSLITAYFRITRKAFVNPEDTASFGKGESAKKYLRTDADVERVRRGHLNDLENIVPFLGIGLLYALSGSDLSTALLHFRIFVGARITHTLAYLIPLPQPARGCSAAHGLNFWASSLLGGFFLDKELRSQDFPHLCVLCFLFFNSWSIIQNILRGIQFQNPHDKSKVSA
uniref:Microsomal glutathione S-transferase 1 n=1 Tax=Cairina moschata TaxID=8855 RepID=A0A8C3BIS0_CAIMO